MPTMLLTLNAGSSSVKFALYGVASGTPLPQAAGQVEGLGTAPVFKVTVAGGETRRDPLDTRLEASPHAAAVNAILDWIEAEMPEARVVAVGHRVVHGGPDLAAPMLIDDASLATLRALIPLAPLHQPHNIAGIEAARAAFPGAPQVACFDTAFHRGHPLVADTFALPRRYYDQGVRRYGFHGLSYEFVSQQMRHIAPTEAAANVVIAHLGNGASMCGVRDGRSVASTMGFTALDGLPMGTRCGQVDPGVLLYLMQHDGLDYAALSDLLYNQSGLKGLSGVSSDMRELEASDRPEAAEAIAYFVARIRRELAALAADLGGLDAVVFTGGIGENSARIRAAVLDGMGWLGIALDPQANAARGPLISQPDSAVRAFVIRTDEEAMIAQHTIRTAGLAAASHAA